jgi:Bcr/CflA subfamily drug resistance transporter
MPANPALGIDFGTSNTTAVIRRSDDRVETVVFDGSPLLPSAVFIETDGTILVGRDAVDSARLDPARFEPHPKRRVDDGAVLLGDSEIPVGELFAAVLGRVRRECEQILGAIPSTVVLTHPASWGPTRRLVLQEAAREAGLPAASLVPEPVAAAAYYVAELGNQIPVGSAVVVHDFGGGTFDASVVRRTRGGFEVLAVDGLDDLGGRDIDQAIVNRLRESLGTDPEWERLLHPTSAADRRQWRAFHDDVRAAKERLSRNSSADLYLPVLDREVHFTREELETLTAPLLTRAPGIVKGVIRASGLPESAIAGVFLVGGASRMPLAATMLHRELGRPPTVIDRLEQVVAHGALLSGAVESDPEPPQAAPDSPQLEPYRPVPPQASTGPYQPVPPQGPGPYQPVPGEPHESAPPQAPSQPGLSQATPEAYQPVPPQTPYQLAPPDPYAPTSASPLPAPHLVPVLEGKPVRSRAAYPVLGAFAAGTAAVPFAFDMVLPGLPVIAAELGTLATAVQLTLSAFLIGAALGLFATGPFSDRFGRRGPLLIGTALFALSSLTAAFASDIAMLTGTRFAQGLAAAACMVLIRAVLHDRADGPRLARSLAVLGVLLGAASLVAPILGGAVVSALGWRSVFQILAVLGAVSTLVVLFGVPETLPKERRGVHADKTPIGRHGTGIALTVALCAAAMFVYLGGSSFVFIERFGTSPLTYGVIVASNAASALIGGAVIGNLSRRGRPKRLLHAAIAIAMIGAILATIGATISGLALASLLVVFLGLGGVMPAALAAAQGLGPDVSRSIAARAGTLSCLCGAIAAPLIAEAATPMAVTMLVLLALAALAATLTTGKSADPAPETTAREV